MPRVDE
jgi:hypothetical protein